MAARAGVGYLINLIRGMTNAGTADWSLGTAVYWDDDHIQEILDNNRYDFFGEVLDIQPQMGNGGTAFYRIYNSENTFLETVDSGTAIFNLYKANAEQIGGGTSLFSVDYSGGIVTFDHDQRGTAWSLTGRRFDINSAAADIWERKTAYFAEAYDISTDSQSLKRSQMMDHCMKMADKYRSLAGVESITAERWDTC